ncbi:hypothetical protein [Endozoicomonas sp. ALB115]|uniref:hypothetical protein n=1 Tax=Endozoicomonas sp. ALB115 TaxID=3403074 RepID=UPI003BB537D4
MSRFIAFFSVLFSLQVLASDIESYERHLSDRLEGRLNEFMDVIESSTSDDEYAPSIHATEEEILEHIAPSKDYKSRFLEAFSHQLREIDSVLSELSTSDYVEEKAQCGSVIERYRHKEMDILKQWEKGFSGLPFETAEQRVNFSSRVNAFMAMPAFLAGNVTNVYIACLYPESKPLIVFDPDKMGSMVQWH